MSTAVLTVLVVVIPASASSLLVLALDIRAHRRRPPARRAPVSSRLTAGLGAALGVAGFGLVSIAGLAGPGHGARAAETSEQQLWVVPAGSPSADARVPVGVAEEAAVQLPFAPLVLWGAGLDETSGTYSLLAEVAGGSDIPLLAGAWRGAPGEGAHRLALLDPNAIAAAARAHGVLPRNGVYDLELRSSDPSVSLRLALAAPPVIASPATPLTGTVASAARPPLTAAAPPAPRVGVPATGGGAPLLGGVAMILGGGACAVLSLRPRRSVAGR